MLVVLVVLCHSDWILKADNQQELRIYLPNKKCLGTDTITLGRIAMVLGEQSLAESANAVPLGHFSMPGQEIRLDRRTILSRLAGEGIQASIRFNGSETIRVQREGHCVQSDQFVKAAESCLKKALADEDIESFKLLRTPDHFPLPSDSKDVTLSACLFGNQTGAVRRVRVSVIRNDEQLSQQDVVFTIQYKCHRLVALKDIPVNVPITPENARIESYLSNIPGKNDSMLYGMMARRTITAGTVIAANMVEPKQPEILVKRRQKVLLRLESKGLFVSALGEAMSDGGVGDLVEVKRGKGSEQRIILGRVMPDGAVEPVL
jgi:flagella basal body P-ring formation protein FlgA